MQEFKILPTGKYRSIKQELSQAGKTTAMQEFRFYQLVHKWKNKRWKQPAMQEFMILPTGKYRSIKQELQSCWQQTGHAGIHDSTNWSIKQELSHAGNKLAMQEFMILPTGMYRSIKQELSHAGNKLAMQGFMILPTGMSIKQVYKTKNLVMLGLKTNWPCRNS
ncbi:ENO [Mytilus coruscus]|uniref:ENO n=1 Tax=Mytilus coruscus TaxID=42192 RepID=A0A6J8BET2_MYTCO|nr:ENO [Mytilus coruscus]